MVELRLDIGAGDNRRPGFTTVDRREDADVVCDLEHTPLPFAAGSVAEVRAEQVLEHIHGLIPLMNDLHRILTAAGKLAIESPVCTDGSRWFGEAFRDPTHVRFFTHETFDYFTIGGRYEREGRSYGIVMWERLVQRIGGWNMHVELRKPTQGGL